MDLALLEQTLAAAGEPRFRARQIWEWAARGASGYGEMTNLPAALRTRLTEAVPFSTLTPVHEAQSRDGTLKVLFHTADARPVEAVLMRYRDGRRSLCLSSQSGCPLTCTFCATGSMRFGRNLTASEIVDQALHFRRVEDVDHAVFMGMGEPLMNLDDVLAAARRLPDVGITHRRTTISTVGWLPGIDRLTEDPAPIRLALSLHAPDDALRSEIMPVNERYPLADVLAACRRWHERKRRRVFIEYVMLAGVNDRYEQALALAELLGPEIFKVNLIPFNPTGTAYEGSSPEAIDAFRAVLSEHRVPVTVRLTRGRDIDAACGQLAAARIVPAMATLGDLRVGRQVRANASVTSDRVAEVNAIFGLSPDGEEITILGDTRVPTTGLVLITGMSGAGKTTLLRVLAERFPDARTLPPIPDDDRPIIELVGTDVAEGIRWLSKFGLGEARLMTTPARALSDGQRARLRLALLLRERPQRIIVDEFLAVLDRLTAKVVAYNVQKLCRELDVTAYLAAAHDDLAEALAPDAVVSLDLSGGSRTTPFRGEPRIAEAEEIVVEEGTPGDYQALARFHYISHLASEAPIEGDEWENVVSQIRVARFRGEPVGVIVASRPVSRTLEHIPFFRLLNEHALVWLRAIVHPAFRGIGLTARLQPVPGPSTRCVIACSALGRYFPFFLASGYELIEHSRALRYPEHDELRALLLDLGARDVETLNVQANARAFVAGLEGPARARVRALAETITVRSSVDYCWMFAAEIGFDLDPDSTREQLSHIYGQLAARVPDGELGALVSESLYFPVQGFVKRVAAT